MVAVISKSHPSDTHVAPSDDKLVKDGQPPSPPTGATQPTPPTEKIDKQVLKEEGSTKGKPKVPSAATPPKTSPSEPQLPPKERERRVIIRSADRLNFAGIEKEINNLAKKANNGTISIDEMAGGTFTISNGGVYGSLLSTPIINPPQVIHLICKQSQSSAILGMHSIVSRPMVVDGNIVPRPMMYIALTYDHRLIDGREAVFFLRCIKDVVEDPRRLLLDL
ncbi:hypothetical protein B296_00032057 [Ensete ventricosum]|uniref:dihydrolipoyllysine-residue succinyltransferase n=1 Tax=Ensete ventricosum TaxID=4639 RepID=A0A426YPY8_ENSVE|nr:hypothetical protein B296_00032057 [Ensete ventricosum]